MQRRRLSCPKCGDRRVDRYGVGTDFEEARCTSCGFIAYLGRAREHRGPDAEPRE